MPFIELGKDMRTLTSAALKEYNSANEKIPDEWLEKINRKAGSYAKHQGHVASEYKRINGMLYNVSISAREKEILYDLSHGLTRQEIADSRNLSINSVKMIINSVYSKLGADNLASLIRIAMERKLI
jgi:LuxR family maltose regulon positive regulatory protein